jgi:CDP-diacylglycerol---serine O-phosphatidyltransferase
MIAFLKDPANAITAAGIAISATALLAVLADKVEIAIAFGLWSLLADQIDGLVARRTPNRISHAPEIGKSLDGLGDLLYGATLPALAIVSAANGSPGADMVAIALVVAGALRLSYFNVFGLVDGRFSGVPLSYDLPLLSIFLLVRPIVPAANFAPLLEAAFAAMAVLHVAPLRVPAPRGRAYPAMIATCVFLSSTLILQFVWLHL